MKPSLDHLPAACHDNKVLKHSKLSRKGNAEAVWKVAAGTLHRDGASSRDLKDAWECVAHLNTSKGLQYP